MNRPDYWFLVALIMWCIIEVRITRSKIERFNVG